MRIKRLESIYHGMKQRCYYEKHTGYERYGGRGITVCDEWKNSYKAFFKWALANGYNEHLTLDRIDNDGNYEPSNCRWITVREQAYNRCNQSNTGVVGVYYNEAKNLYEARIRIGTKLLYLGRSKDLQEAIALRKQAESTLICNQIT